MNWKCRYLFEGLNSILSDKHQETGLLNHIVGQLLNFLKLLSTVDTSFYFPINSVIVFQVLYILTNTCYYHLLLLLFYIIMTILTGKR